MNLKQISLTKNHVNLQGYVNFYKHKNFFCNQFLYKKYNDTIDKTNDKKMDYCTKELCLLIVRDYMIRRFF